MARETWLIQANPDECLEKLLEGVEAKGEEEHLRIHKVCFSLSLSLSLSLSRLVPRLCM